MTTMVNKWKENIWYLVNIYFFLIYNDYMIMLNNMQWLQVALVYRRLHACAYVRKVTNMESIRLSWSTRTVFGLLILELQYVSMSAHAPLGLMAARPCNKYQPFIDILLQTMATVHCTSKLTSASAIFVTAHFCTLLLHQLNRKLNLHNVMVISALTR